MTQEQGQGERRALLRARSPDGLCVPSVRAPGAGRKAAASTTTIKSGGVGLKEKQSSATANVTGFLE